MSMQVVRIYRPDDSVRVVRVRSSESPGVTVAVSPEEWSEFISRVKDGAFDRDILDA